MVGAGRGGAAAISALSSKWTVQFSGRELWGIAPDFDRRANGNGLVEVFYMVEKSRSKRGNDRNGQIDVSGVKACGAEASIQSGRVKL